MPETVWIQNVHPIDLKHPECAVAMLNPDSFGIHMALNND